MNFKKVSILFAAFLCLFLAISAISATSDLNSTSISEQPEEISVASDSINEVITDISDNNDSSSTVNVEPKEDTTSTNTQTEPKQVISKPKPVRKIATKTEADIVAFKYKSKNYFKVEIEDRYDDDIPIKNVKVKLKIYTGTSSKTYIVKTNSRGIAKFNTQNLKPGSHKVVITSADDRYKINKVSKIIIGKQYSTVLKAKSTKVLKTKDKIALKFKNDFDEKEVKVIFKKKSKHTIISKAKFYFKNTYTGKVVTKVDYCDFDDGRWEMPEEDYPNRFTLLKVKVWYLKV
jgi:hypothetical protein